MPRNTQFTGKRKNKSKQRQKKAQMEFAKMKMAEKAGVTLGKLKSYLKNLFSPASYYNFRKSQNAKRPCMACGKSHRHNNAFCSAHCSKDFKRLYKAEGGHNVLRAA